MKPVNFKGVNRIIGEDQPEYQPLPAMVTPDGIITSCWELTEEEFQEISRTRKLYLQQMTFNQPMQPILPVVDLADGLTLNL